MGRSIAAVVLGYLITAFLAMAGTMVSMAAFLDRPAEGSLPTLTPAYVIANMTASLLAAGIGGFACAAFARRRPVTHGAALAAVFVVLALALSRTGRAHGQTSWYAPVIAAVGAAGAIAGTVLHRVLTASRPAASV